MATKLNEQQKMVYDDLSMPEKIAILLIQLGEDVTTLLFSHMEVDVITEISRYIATAKSMDKNVAAAVLEEFYALMQSNQYMRSGGLEYAKEILYRTFGPETAQKILDKLAKSMENSKSFGYLTKVKPQQLADFIMTEHPQTIALILAHMDSTSAAETLSFFNDELRSEVVVRMANLGDISPSIIKRVSTVLEGKQIGRARSRRTKSRGRGVKPSRSKGVQSHNRIHRRYRRQTRYDDQRAYVYV